MPTVTICAPSAKHVLPPQPSFFNPYRHAPVGAEMDGDGEMTSATRLSFSDYERMSVQTRNAAVYRQKPTPEYALDHNKMRRLLVRFMEARAFSKKQIAAGLTGSDATRLQRAQEKLAADRPRLIALADKLCKEYTEAKSYGAHKEWLKHAAGEIENVDTQLRMQEENFPAVVLGVIYRSYCCGDNSVEVGNALSMKPPFVRQLLARLKKTWNQIQAEDAAPTAAGRLRKTPLKRLVAERAESAKWFANLTPEKREARKARDRIASSIARENARRTKALNTVGG